MHLVVCHVADTSAVRAYEALRTRAPDRVDCITVEQLCAALAWEHRLDSTSSTFRVRLADGRVLDGEDIGGVLNRIVSVAPIGADRAEGDDGLYATQEFTAFFLSWLSSLGPRVVNQATPQGLAGAERSAVEWAWLARDAGLPVLPWLETTPPLNRGGRDTSSRAGDLLRAYVLGDRVVGRRLDAEVRAGCRELARRADVQLLGVSLTSTPLGAAFVSATPTPHLPVDDEDFVDALCDLLGVDRAA